MDYITAFLDFQASFKGVWLEQVVQERVEIPVFMVVLYLTLVFHMPEVMARRAPANLRPFFMGWNLLLAVFSILGAFYTIPVLVDKLINHGFRFTVCQQPDEGFYHDNEVGFWVALFVLSKIPELMDTVFLVMQKKEVIFLHWFHHCTVMLYCWHAYAHRIGAGLWFASMNYGVHAIMYSYYFLMCFQFGRKLVRPFAIYITSLQILQMVVGMTVMVASYIFFDSKNPASCAVNQSNMRMGLMMYTSYFILFGTLFKKLYFSKKGKHSKATKAEKDICSVSAETTVETLVGARKQE